jgi:hypothetical protein
VSTLQIELSPDLDARLQAVAADQGTSKADVAKKLIETGLTQGQIKTETNVPISTGSILDLVRDLVGKFEGPGDLSTNPKYMEGFGK